MKRYTVAIVFTDLEAESADAAARDVLETIRCCDPGDTAVRVYEGGGDPIPLNIPNETIIDA